MQEILIDPKTSTPQFGGRSLDLPAPQKRRRETGYSVPDYTYKAPKQPWPTPRGTDCLKKVLTQIKTEMGLGKDCSIFLYVVDDIDFDCRQPFLQQVLEALVASAVTATGGRGECRIDVLATQYDDQLLMQVADSGQEMPADMVQWFQNQCTDPAPLRGRVGLEQAAKLINRAGGKLNLVSSGNNGTRLGFSLPLVQPVEDVGDPYD